MYNDGEVIKYHETGGTMNRAQQALLLRQKQLDKQSGVGGEVGADSSNDENGNSDSDDLFGDENDEGLTGPLIVVPEGADQAREQD